jgi:hypothetical protein
LVLSDLNLLLLSLSALERTEVTAALETFGSDETLDLGTIYEGKEGISFGTFSRRMV